MTWVIVIVVAIAAVCAVSWWRAGRQKAELEHSAQRPGLSDHQMEGQSRADLDNSYGSGRFGAGGL